MKLSYSDTKTREEIRSMYQSVDLIKLLKLQNQLESIYDTEELGPNRDLFRLLRQILRQVIEEKLR